MSDMENMVGVDFNTNAICVNDQWLFGFNSLSIDTIKDTLPDNLKDKIITFINWYKDNPMQTGFTTSDGAGNLFEPTEENYNKWVKPYVDIWQVKKDEQEQEQQEALEQYNQIQNVKSRAMNYVNQTWDSIEETASVESSLGYTIGVSEKDIKFYTARIETMEDTETVVFKDYHNIERTGVTKANFVTMRKEAYAEYLNLLNIKSEYEANIEQCSTKEQVIALISQLNVFNPSLAPVTDI